MMRWLNPFRWASVLFALHALGHTWGALLNVPRFGPESDAVVVLMQSVHLQADGAVCTWYGFYLGFGWIATVYLAFASFLAWRLGRIDQNARAALAPVAWGLLVAQVATIPIVWLYFFPIPMVFTALESALLAIGCFQLWRRGRAAA